MNKIRIRAWDKNKEKMYFPHRLNLAENGDVVGLAIFNERNEWDSMEIEDLSVMEWTGLTDMDGNDIYEGDICNCWYKNTPENKFTLPVVFHKGAFRFHLVSDICEDLELYDFVKVVGNVWKNPELLK